MQLIDTHTHLDFEMFDDDRAQVIARARNAGVERIVVLGVHAANWQRVWQLAFSPDGKFLYTTNGNSNDISVIDVANRKVVKSVQVGEQPWGVVVAPN